MKKIIALGLSAILVLGMTGCSNHADYYKAVHDANDKYAQAYAGVKNEEVTFNGVFEGQIHIIKPKKLPQFQQVVKPKDTADYALAWGQIILPTAAVLGGLYYGYKTQESNNYYNAQNLETWTSNYKNESMTNISTTTTTPQSLSCTNGTCTTTNP